MPTDTAPLLPVYCRGCGRLMGSTTVKRSLVIFCDDPSCPTMPMTSENESRDRLIEQLLAEGEHPAAIADLFGISRPFVYQFKDS